MGELTVAQQEAWQNVLSLLGLPLSSGSGSVRISGSEGYLSSKPGRDSLAVAHQVKLTSMDQARSLVGGSLPPSSDAAAPELGHVSESRLRRALFSHVVGREIEAAGYGSLLTERFFPLPVTVYTGKTIEIKKGEVLTIEPDGHDPVVVNYELVTLEQGGLIKCEAPVLFIVQKFIKKK